MFMLRAHTLGFVGECVSIGYIYIVWKTGIVSLVVYAFVALAIAANS